MMKGKSVSGRGDGLSSPIASLGHKVHLSLRWSLIDRQTTSANSLMKYQVLQYILVWPLERLVSLLAPNIVISPRVEQGVFFYTPFVLLTSEASGQTKRKCKKKTTCFTSGECYFFPRRSEKRPIYSLLFFLER